MGGILVEGGVHFAVKLEKNRHSIIITGKQDFPIASVTKGSIIHQAIYHL
jgi:hypothetical protein